jgi:hypothetical protein
MDRISESDAGPEQLLALGLIGDPAAVPALLYHLRDDEHAETAALALHLVTGAEMFEDIPVRSEPEEPVEADDDEEVVAEPPSPAPPTMVVRLLQDAALWTTWWEEHRLDFRDGVRYRLGEPVTPLSLLATLASERLPRTARQLAGEEMAIRYGCDVPFESDLFVRDQRKAIGDMEAWARAGSFQPGAWYLAGRRLTV